MRRSPPAHHLHLLAAAAITDTAAMSSRPSFRGGRHQWRRGFSDRANSGARGQLVTDDSQFRSARETTLFQPQHPSYNSVPPPPSYKQHFPRPAPYGQSRHQFPQPPPYGQNRRHFTQPPPYSQDHHHFPQPSPYSQNQRPRRPFNQNQAPRPSLSRPPKTDYRSWEHAKTAPLPNSERFIVLSYNILADYLAIDHRSKLYFHIPRYMLDWQWRKRNLIFELGLWSADIMCFQEVDKFHELEEELKLRGYNGIWKMRTGNAVDGCAIFWRSSRFKLLYEESIEFNQFELRNNVAQICVLELFNRNKTENAETLQTSSTGSNKVVMCNIHVLYNPKRGEIKLGQVRRLLDKAHAVSKSWHDAPVVLCGDFNCTPKSPLYNFISEQKFDLLGVDRDKVSGQASAEIRPNLRNQSAEGSIQLPSTVDGKEFHTKLNDTHPSMLKEQDGDRNVKNDPSINNLSQSSGMLSDSTNASSDNVKCTSNNCTPYNEVISESQQIAIDVSDVETGSALFVAVDSSTESSSHKSEGIPGSLASQSIANDEMGSPSISSQIDFSGISTGIEEEVENLSFEELQEGRSTAEDDNVFLAALNGSEDAFSTEFAQSVTLGLDNSSEDISSPQCSQLGAQGDEIQDYVSHSLDTEAVNMVEATYDPSLWTPIDIATATGREDSTSVEHPLRLKSTYTEVEGFPGTRDLNGEPLVTSYNRCFMGTVDYIWRSEGLQTVRVLAPIPKHAMQWTSGFPTKKWGSDHVALASELAFTKD